MSQTPQSTPWVRGFVKWFDPRGRSINMIGFILNRITALGLTLYLFLHLVMLSRLAAGPEAYAQFLEIVHNPVFIFGELLVVAGGVIHGLNGIRIGLTSFGIGTRSQKAMLVVLLSAAVLISLYFAVRMFTA